MKRILLRAAKGEKTALKSTRYTVSALTAVDFIRNSQEAKDNTDKFVRLSFIEMRE